jgi:protein-S-isoprenylcysteine O-methyltransferase Ste14
MNGFLDKGGLWVLAQNLLTLAVLASAPILGHRAWPTFWIGLGGLLFVIGAVFGVAGVRALGRSLTPFPKPIHDAPLVQAGIYQIVRHPLYSSLIFLSAGWSLFWSSWIALAIALALAVVLDRKSRVEERWLRKKFPDYASYRRRVRRFVPWIY